MRYALLLIVLASPASVVATPSQRINASQNDQQTHVARVVHDTSPVQCGCHGDTLETKGLLISVGLFITGILLLTAVVRGWIPDIQIVGS